jgi:hypothetical protein
MHKTEERQEGGITDGSRTHLTSSVLTPPGCTLTLTPLSPISSSKILATKMFPNLLCPYIAHGAVTFPICAKASSRL